MGKEGNGFAGSVLNGVVGDEGVDNPFGNDGEGANLEVSREIGFVHNLAGIKFSILIQRLVAGDGKSQRFRIELIVIRGLVVIPAALFEEENFTVGQAFAIFGEGEVRTFAECRSGSTALVAGVMNRDVSTDAEGFLQHRFVNGFISRFLVDAAFQSLGDFLVGVSN